ncbi:hypothetical protein ADU37_CDS21960 [Thermococcus sp. 2319x1]|nr:hypothetical protein ADU37_CDS21960 [Thermococcus sp. 2319x1]
MPFKFLYALEIERWVENASILKRSFNALMLTIPPNLSDNFKNQP